MKIRHAKLSDVNAIYKLGNKEFKEEIWFDKSLIRNLIKNYPQFTWLLEDNEKIIGARFVFESWGETAWGWLLVIKEDLRGKGLGTFLFNETCNKLKKMGYNRLMTDVYVKNKGSIKWHNKVGYKNIGKVKDWFGKNKDAIIFLKQL